MDSRTPIRHGEVLLLPVSTAPAGTARSVTHCIVGHSESGHHHVLESEATITEIVTGADELYVDLDAPTRLRHHKSHDQHRDLLVPPGVWRVLRKTEFDIRELPDVLPELPVQPQRIPDSDYVAPPERRALRNVRD